MPVRVKKLIKKGKRRTERKRLDYRNSKSRKRLMKSLHQEEVEISKLEHDPSSNSTCASISEEDLEELMTSIKKDPYLKPILEDWWSNHNDEHVFRYLNDPEVFQKFAQAMGFGVLGDNVSPVEDNASNAVAEDYTDK
ncbi:uncharacterized protein LOC113358822 [Papaver somniferum]|uniref:uncharacterized protein LOC113358822 n=1 Tax=Papaver somniferum TaxID=3469 RepID=UPI000E7059F8|nr:uncharacterized protein LOC113358822 [Papaver somniferum]XP_026458316.1 uncharacterized protein LOC113358822 [Papaver somniferum]